MRGSVIEYRERTVAQTCECSQLWLLPCSIDNMRKRLTPLAFDAHPNASLVQIDKDRPKMGLHSESALGSGGLDISDKLLKYLIQAMVRQVSSGYVP